MSWDCCLEWKVREVGPLRWAMRAMGRCVGGGKGTGQMNPEGSRWGARGPNRGEH